jgi:hypothetical protein
MGKLGALLACMLVLSMLAGCGGSVQLSASSPEASGAKAGIATAQATATQATDSTAANSALDSGAGAVETPTDGVEESVAEALAGKGQAHETGDDGMGPGFGGAPGARPGRDAFAAASDYYLHINGGYVALYATGDGIDVNGSIVMTEGVVIVHGPTANMNGALDYDRSFTLSGGFLVAAGSAGMAQAPDESSTQPSVLINLDNAIRAGTLVHIRSSEGAELLTFAPAKDTQSIVLSSPDLQAGATYEVYFGGDSSGTAVDGLYQNGTYSSGSLAGSFGLTGIVTRLGRTSRR